MYSYDNLSFLLNIYNKYEKINIINDNKCYYLINVLNKNQNTYNTKLSIFKNEIQKNIFFYNPMYELINSIKEQRYKKINEQEYNEELILYYYLNYDSKIEIEGSDSNVLYSLLTSKISSIINKRIFTIRNCEYNEDEFKNFFIDNKMKYCVYLSGWNFYQYNNSHAINIVIEKIDNNISEYNVYIINSGKGLNYHYKKELTCENIYKSPVVIKYNNIVKDKIFKLFKMLNILLNISTIYNLFYAKEATNINTLMISINKYGLNLCEESLKYYFLYNKNINNNINNNIDETHNFFIYDKAKLFYEESVFNVLEKDFTIVALDQSQISGSCSFYSSYYTFKHVIKCGNNSNHICSEYFVDTISDIISDFFIINKDYNKMTNYLLDIKKINYREPISSINLFVSEINFIRKFNDEYTNKLEHIIKSNNFLKNINNDNDIKYFIQNLYFKHFIQLNYKNIWLYKYINFNVIAKKFKEIFDESFFKSIASMTNKIIKLINYYTINNIKIIINNIEIRINNLFISIQRQIYDKYDNDYFNVIKTNMMNEIKYDIINKKEGYNEPEKPNKFNMMINTLDTIIFDINMLVQSSFIDFNIIELFKEYNGLIYNFNQNNSLIYNYNTKFIINNSNDNPILYWYKKIYERINIDKVIQCINKGLNINVMYDIFFIIIFNYFTNDDLDKEILIDKIRKIHEAVIKYNNLITNNNIKLNKINDIFFIILFNTINDINTIEEAQENFIKIRDKIPYELNFYVYNITMLILYKIKNKPITYTNEINMKYENFTIYELINKFFDENIEINSQDKFIFTINKFKYEEKINEYSKIWTFNSNNIFVVVYNIKEYYLLLIKPWYNQLLQYFSKKSYINTKLKKNNYNFFKLEYKISKLLNVFNKILFKDKSVWLLRLNLFHLLLDEVDKYEIIILYILLIISNNVIGLNLIQPFINQIIDNIELELKEVINELQEVINNTENFYYNQQLEEYQERKYFYQQNKFYLLEDIKKIANINIYLNDLNYKNYEGIEKFNKERDDHIVKKQKSILKEKINLSEKKITCNYQNIQMNKLDYITENFTNFNILLKKAKEDKNFAFTGNYNKHMYYYIHEVLNNKIISNEQHKILESIFGFFDRGETKTHNIIMGKGKTSTITPMIVFRNYVEKGMNKVRIIMPDNLINQSYKIFLKYINIIPFLNISIFKADKHDIELESKDPDIKVNKKYNSFFDGDKTQIYVSLTGISELKKFLIKNLAFVNKESWKEDYDIIDEIDSIIDPCKSEINLVTDIINNKNINKYILTKWIYLEKNEVNELNNKCLEDNFKILREQLENKILVYNRDYGLGENELYAIPYLYSNVPNYESVFTDMIVNIVLLNESYYNMIVINKKLRYIDIKTMYNFFQKSKVILINKSVKDLYEVLSNIQSINSIIIKEIEEEYINELLKDDEGRKEIFNIITQYLINDIKINRKQNNLSAIDILIGSIFLGLKTKIQFSGTTNFPKNITGFETEMLKLFISNIKIHNIAEQKNLEINIEKAKKIEYDKIDIVDDIIDNILIKILFSKIEKNIKEFNCLIDSGGVFVKEPIINIVKTLYNKLGYNIYYVDLLGERQIYNNGNITPYMNQLIDDQQGFIYYGQKDCVGVDFVLKDTKPGIIMISKISTLETVKQAFFRKRNILKNENEMYYCILSNIIQEEIKKQKSFSLLNFLKFNTNKNITQQTERLSNQLCKYKQREQEIDNHVILYEEELDITCKLNSDIRTSLCDYNSVSTKNQSQNHELIKNINDSLDNDDKPYDEIKSLVMINNKLIFNFSNENKIVYNNYNFYNLVLYNNFKIKKYVILYSSLIFLLEMKDIKKIEPFCIYDKFGRIIKSNKYDDLKIFDRLFNEFIPNNLIKENENEISQIIKFYKKLEEGELKEYIKNCYNFFYKRLIKNNNILQLI